MSRLPTGGLIDRARPLNFTFDGKSFSGYHGDTLASALLANDVRLVGRSFKYHRPRGILTAGPEEPNALVELRGGAHREPNTRATTIELFAELASTSQNRYPSLNFDLLAATSLLAPIFAAGFYYKTFMWPAAFWEKLYEPAIRRAAGLGRASGLPDPDTYEKQSIFADILIIGAGRAGLAAALEHAETGASIILAEQDFALGGRLLSDRGSIDDMPAADWLEAAIAKLRAAPNVTILTRTTITGVYDGPLYTGIERVTDHLAGAENQPRQRLWRICAKSCVLATGAIERPLVFGGNDIPGVMLASAIRSYINRFAVKPGSRAVVFANNDEAATTLTDLAAAGIEVAALIDPRPEIPASIRQVADSAGAKIYAGSTIRQAKGGKSLARIMLGGTSDGIEIACDLLAMSGGWNPTLHLASHHGGKPVWNESIAAFTPGPLPPGMSVIGAAASQSNHERVTAPLYPLWQVTDSRGKAFVDFQNDVTASDIKLAAAEGFTAVEHLKRYTTLGMATDQGKTSNVTGLALMAGHTGRSIAQTGTTVFRPPYTPTAIGTLAGPHTGKYYRPTRRTPAHGWAESQNACFIEAGEWLRASYFPRPGESIQQATNREVLTVRKTAGFCDVTTLGKIDVQGPDAALFLDFIYANAISTLKPGRVRYGIMLRDDGMVFDDGTVACTAPGQYILTTTTANAARVLRHMDYALAILRPELDCCIEPVTDQWAQFALAGPQARAILASLTEADVSDAALPFMGTIPARLAGIPGRLFRISFSGEMAYEIAVPAAQGEALARALHAAGATPYGLEALNVLRLEKGHPVGAELNGQTSAADLGMGGLLSKKKDFIGRVLSQRPALRDPNRETLIGLRPTTPGATLQAGSHLLPLGAPATAENDQGHITSAAYSATLGHAIALALLRNGPARIGERLIAANPIQGQSTEVEIVPRIFHDPEGRALHG
jgi:sarcosine oxidase subunit alpha